MEEKVLKYREKIIAGLALSLVFTLSFVALSPLGVMAEEEEDTVSVGATSADWLNFSVQNPYDEDGGNVELGEMVDSSGNELLGMGYTNLRTGSNSSDGWQVQASGEDDCDGGNSCLVGGSSGYEIPSIGSFRDVSTGESGYGMAVLPLLADENEGDDAENDEYQFYPDWYSVDTEGNYSIYDDGEPEEDGAFENYSHPIPLPDDSDTVWEDNYGWKTGGLSLTDAKSHINENNHLGYDDSTIDHDAATVYPGPVPTDAEVVLTTDDANYDGLVAEFWVFATAQQITPSDDYSDTITLTASLPAN